MDDNVTASRIKGAFASVTPPTSRIDRAGSTRRRPSMLPAVSMAVVLLIVVGGAGAAWLLLSSPCGFGTGCATPPPTLPPNAITRDQAAAEALRQAPPAMRNPTVLWAMTGQNPFDNSAVPPVWLVRLGGSGLPTCAPGYLERPESPSDAPCLDDHFGEVPRGLTAALDPVTGRLLGWTH